MKPSKLLSAFFLVIMMSSAAHSQTSSYQTANQSATGGNESAASESSLQPAPLISKITFSGLKRTKDSYLQKVFKDFIGKPADETVMHRLETSLQSLNLFSKADISTAEVNTEGASDGGNEVKVELNISVKEKICFIPVPFIAGGSGGFMGGAFIMNTNAFGQKDMITVGGIGSASRIFGMGTYMHPAKVGEPGGMVFLSGSKSNQVYNNADGDKILEFDSFGVTARTGAIFKLDRFNQISAGLGYKGFFFDGDYDFGDKLYNRNAGSFNGSWTISAQDWNGIFLSATSLNVSSETSVDNKGRVVEVVSSKFSLQQPVTQKLRFCSVAGGAVTVNGLITDKSGESAAGVTILDDKYVSEKLCGLSTGLEYALFRFKIGTFSTYGNYEAVFSQDSDDSLDFAQGFSAGGKLYMAQLSMPALSFGLNYNATKSVMGFSFSLGMGF